MHREYYNLHPTVDEFHPPFADTLDSAKHWALFCFLTPREESE